MFSLCVSGCHISFSTAPGVDAALLCGATMRRLFPIRQTNKNPAILWCLQNQRANVCTVLESNTVTPKEFDVISHQNHNAT